MQIKKAQRTEMRDQTTEARQNTVSNNNGSDTNEHEANGSADDTGSDAVNNSSHDTGNNMASDDGSNDSSNDTSLNTGIDTDNNPDIDTRNNDGTGTGNNTGTNPDSGTVISTISNSNDNSTNHSSKVTGSITGNNAGNETGYRPSNNTDKNLSRDVVTDAVSDVGNFIGTDNIGNNTHIDATHDAGSKSEIPDSEADSGDDCIIQTSPHTASTCAPSSPISNAGTTWVSRKRRVHSDEYLNQDRRKPNLSLTELEEREETRKDIIPEKVFLDCTGERCCKISDILKQNPAFYSRVHKFYGRHGTSYKLDIKNSDSNPDRRGYRRTHEALKDAGCSEDVDSHGEIDYKWKRYTMN